MALTRRPPRRLFFAEDRSVISGPHSLKHFIAEGTVDSKLFRVPFSNVFPNEVRITTAFRISRKRRRA